MDSCATGHNPRMAVRPTCRHGLRVALVAASLAVSIAGCGSTTSPTGVPPAQTTPSSSVGTPAVRASVPVSTGAAPSTVATPQVVDPQALIETADLADGSTLDNISTLRFTHAGADAANAVLQAGGSADALWAALWVYASAGTDPAPVEPLLTNGDPSVAALAAAILVGIGDAAGLDPLRAMLDADGQMRDAEPPLSLREFALETLARYVTGSDVPDPQSFADDASAATAWQAWLDAKSRPTPLRPGPGRLDGSVTTRALPRLVAAVAAAGRGLSPPCLRRARWPHPVDRSRGPSIMQRRQSP